MKVNVLLYGVGSIWMVALLYSVRLINQTVPGTYMDEIFHYPMTERYFRGNYTYWDPKITTFPGLYIVGTLACKVRQGMMTLLNLQGANTCPLSYLRYMNICILMMTAIQLYRLIQHIQSENKIAKNFLWMLHVISLPTIFCPFFLYYTDGLSLLLCVLAILYGLYSDRGVHKKYVYWSALFVGLAVLVRQTNIILAPLIPAILLMQRYGILYANEKYSSMWSQLGRFFYMLYQEFTEVIQLILPYLLIVFAFFLFFLFNHCSIVVGDHEHHRITFSLIQICYFSVCFCLSYVDEIVLKIWSLLRKSEKYSKQTQIRWVYLMIICLTFSFYCVHYRFSVHPFILSDNRHFIFYLFKDIIIPYRYYMIPIFALSLYIMFYLLYSHLTAFAMVIILSLIGLLIVSSSLVEFRYYTLPMTILILLIKPKTHPMISLTISYGMNILTEYLFLYKSFTYTDGSVGRFMW